MQLLKIAVLNSGKMIILKDHAHFFYSKFVNCMMYDGKKSLSQRIMLKVGNSLIDFQLTLQVPVSTYKFSLLISKHFL